MSNKLVTEVFNILCKVPEKIDCTSGCVVDYTKLQQSVT